MVGVPKYGMGVRKNDFAIGDPVALKLLGNLLKRAPRIWAVRSFLLGAVFMPRFSRLERILCCVILGGQQEASQPTLFHAWR